MRIWWLLVAAALTGCAKDVCEIKYRDCCLVEKKDSLTLKGEHCWPHGTFIFNAGDITHLIDQGKKSDNAKPDQPELMIRTSVQTPESGKF